MAIQLQDKLYTSAQVADILGVSLRTLYRYMEDGRILSMRTASGRHRFTKDQIMDFLNAGNIIEDELDNDMHAQSGLGHSKPVLKNPVVEDEPFIDRNFKPQVATRTVPLDDMDFDFRGIQNSTSAQATKPAQPETPIYAPERGAMNSSFQPKPYNPYLENNEDMQNGIRRPMASSPKVAPVARELEPEDEFLRKESLDLEDDIIDTSAKSSSFGLDDDFDVDEYFDTKRSASMDNSRSFAQRNDDLGTVRPAASVTRPVTAPVMPATPKTVPYKGFESDGYTPINRTPVIPERPVKSAWEFSSERKPLATESPVASKEESQQKNSDLLNIRYYKSEFSDLIDLAKKIKETGSARGVDYAFTLNAGLSLHFSINPFEILHFYINPEDLQVWKSDLKLSPVREETESNVGILINTEIIFPQTKEIGGFKVLEDKFLFKDLVKLGDQDLVRRFRSKLGI